MPSVATLVLTCTPPLANALLPARYQMALTLGAHIVLASFGMAMPAMIFVLHRKGLQGDEAALTLAKRWSKVAGVLFAIGAASGTILSFEMGLLWPGLMETYGDVIGLAFALEGISFFTEAIFLGIYIYGWDRLDGRVHLPESPPSSSRRSVTSPARTSPIGNRSSWRPWRDRPPLRNPSPWCSGGSTSKGLATKPASSGVGSKCQSRALPPSWPRTASMPNYQDSTPCLPMTDHLSMWCDFHSNSWSPSARPWPAGAVGGLAMASQHHRLS